MIHHPFAYIDWIVIIAYFAIMMLTGIAVKSEDTIDDYFFAKHQLPWWAVGLSLIATSVSASTFLGYPVEAYQFDLRLLQLNIGVPISIAIVCMIFIPFFQKSDATSAYEVLEKRFDLKTRTLASTIYTLHLLLRTGVLLYGPAIVFSAITGMNIYLTIVIVGVVTILYTAIGGIKAVVWTDVIQFIIFVAGAVLIISFIGIDVAGGAKAILENARDAGKLKLFDATFNISDPRNIWSAGIAYIALDLAIRSTDQQFVQRYLSCKDARRSNYAAILSAVAGLFMAILFFMVGIFLWGFYKQYPEQLEGLKNINEIVPHYIATKLPWGMSGLIVSAIIAAAMSSLDSAIQALANTATVDFYKRIFKGKSPFSFARKISILWGVIGILSGIFASTVGENLLVIALSFTSLFIGSLLGLFILAIFFKKTNANGAFYGALIGMAGLGVITKILKLPVSWPWFPVISMSLTIFSGVLISAFFKKKIKRTSTVQ